MIYYIMTGALGLLLGLLFAFVQHTKYRTTQVQLITMRDYWQQCEKGLNEEKKAHAAATERVIQLDVRNNELKNRLKAYEKEAEAAEEKLLLQFKALSNELLEQKSEKFTKQNKVQLENILTPLRDKIQDFQKQIADTQQVSLAGNLALKQEFQKVNNLYEKIQQESSKATQAIMGDNKLQGTWGEVHALQLLESTGLRKGEQYFVQKGFSATDGKRYVPDIIIKLPDKRSIVMDVKVSLVDYVKFFNAEDEKEKTVYLKKHLQSLKNHIKQLSNKQYAQMYQLHGLDFVLLLLPVEPAFSLAIREEPSLFEEAYEHNIVLVSPTTLRATLSIIEHIWKSAYRNRYALSIAQESGALYNKFFNFIEDLKKIGHQLHLGQRAWEQAMKKLVEGRGNLVAKVEQLKRLGARTNKALDTLLPSLGDIQKASAIEGELFNRE